MSGEHGDGLARSLWNAKLFGPEVYACFEAVKHAFDPANLLNPGKVVAAPDLTDNLRIGPDYHPVEPDTLLDFSAKVDSPGPSRCARGSAPAARPVRGRCVRATWRRATRSTPLAAGPMRCDW